MEFCDFGQDFCDAGKDACDLGQDVCDSGDLGLDLVILQMEGQPYDQPYE